MVYFYYIPCLRCTILVGKPWFFFFAIESRHTILVSQQCRVRFLVEEGTTTSKLLLSKTFSTQILVGFIYFHVLICLIFFIPTTLFLLPRLPLWISGLLRIHPLPQPGDLRRSGRKFWVSVSARVPWASVYRGRRWVFWRSHAVYKWWHLHQPAWVVRVSCNERFVWLRCLRYILF